MTIFFALLIKIISLYIFILLGFIAGRYLHVNKESVARLLIYIVGPVVFFNGVFTTNISLISLTLPFLVFGICCLICIFSFLVGSVLWKDSRRNMLSFISPDGNSGYFGLPVALVLFPSSIIGLYIFAAFGIILYESTLGFFIAAKGRHTVKESIIKLLKLPILYAVFVGIVANLLGLYFGSIYADIVDNFKGAFTVLGMMMIGLGIAGIRDHKFDFIFTGLSFLGKFIFWPILVLIVIFLDSNYFKFYSSEVYKILILLSVLPIAANTVSFATLLKSHPEKVAIAVLFSTLFALFYVPLAVTFFIK